MAKKLYRSNTNKMLGGVCAGLGEYFDVDPTVVRVISVILLFASAGWALMAYIIGWIIIPEADESEEAEKAKVTRNEDTGLSTPRSATWTRYFPGLILIFIGTVLLVREHWFWFSWGEFWPLLLIGGGLIIIFGRRKSPESSTIHAQSQHSNAHNEGTIS